MEGAGEALTRETRGKERVAEKVSKKSEGEAEEAEIQTRGNAWQVEGALQRPRAANEQFGQWQASRMGCMLC